MRDAHFPGRSTASGLLRPVADSGTSPAGRRRRDLAGPSPTAGLLPPVADVGTSPAPHPGATRDAHFSGSPPTSDFTGRSPTSRLRRRRIREQSETPTSPARRRRRTSPAGRRCPDFAGPSPTSELLRPVADVGRPAGRQRRAGQPTLRRTGRPTRRPADRPTRRRFRATRRPIRRDSIVRGNGPLETTTRRRRTRGAAASASPLTARDLRWHS